MRTRSSELGIQLVILQPGAILGPWGESSWCKMFAKIEQDPKMVGLPGSSTFVDARDLAGAFVAAADAGAGAGEAYLIGGTNATNLELQREIAHLIGVPAPTRAVSPQLLMLLARWNEVLLSLPSVPFHALRFKPDAIGHPWLVGKLTQDQTAECSEAKEVLGLRPRPLVEMLVENYRYLTDAGICSGTGVAVAKQRGWATWWVGVIAAVALVASLQLGGA
jgi:dihydroflavonol-4-reductase